MAEKNRPSLFLRHYSSYAFPVFRGAETFLTGAFAATLPVLFGAALGAALEAVLGAAFLAAGLAAFGALTSASSVLDSVPVSR